MEPQPYPHSENTSSGSEVSGGLLWSQEPISYEQRARDLARRIASAFPQQELRQLLLEGLRLHRERGLETFLRTHCRLIYRVVLTRREKAFVRAEMGLWVAPEALEAEVLEAEGEEAADKVREWGDHNSPYHFPSTGCQLCYASLLDVVLRRREAGTNGINLCRRPKQQSLAARYDPLRNPPRLPVLGPSVN